MNPIHSSLSAWVEISEIVTAVATAFGVFSIWVAVLTMKNAEYATANGWMIELDEKFLERPDLREAFFSKDKSYYGSKHEDLALAEYVADSLDFFLKHRFGVGTKWARFKKRANWPSRFWGRTGVDGLQLSWQRWVFRYFSESRLLREYLWDTQSSYAPPESAIGVLFKIYREKHRDQFHALPPSGHGHHSKPQQ